MKLNIRIKLIGLAPTVGHVIIVACCMVYSDHPREAAASMCLAVISGRIASGVPWFLCSSEVPMQLPRRWHHAGTLCPSRGIIELPSTIVTLGTIRPKDRGAVRKATVFQH